MPRYLNLNVLVPTTCKPKTLICSVPFSSFMLRLIRENTEYLRRELANPRHATRIIIFITYHTFPLIASF
ncbi:hypothetical protein N8T08_001641 [Aspergillus melleus]|uniref:Uncharacterized protein n=1 Tax=Aspergillus melleus TaxID=138277 RepID=A0ACC3AN55_9EURO|nr:hypothetical protein N8T08_001641 [Aspergillus melleus]